MSAAPFPRVALVLFLLLLVCAPLRALEWITVGPNSAYSRDLALGGATVPLSWSPQSQSINPAGLSLFDPRTGPRATLFLNPGGLWQIRNYYDDFAADSKSAARIWNTARLAVGGAAVQTKIVNVAALISQPVMRTDDSLRYRDYEHGVALTEHQNSLLVSLALHPRVSIGGRVDRYYRWSSSDEEGYSYGVILRPRNVAVGIQYQRFPLSGARVWHPLDRRTHESTTAAIALTRENFALSVQVMNLAPSDGESTYEPHAGVEWRPVRALALRAGGMQFREGHRWAWTAGLGLIDLNWFHARYARLIVPDEFLQLAVGVIYQRRIPVQGISSLTCSWRF